MKTYVEGTHQKCICEAYLMISDEYSQHCFCGDMWMNAPERFAAILQTLTTFLVRKVPSFYLKPFRSTLPPPPSHTHTHTPPTHPPQCICMSELFPLEVHHFPLIYLQMENMQISLHISAVWSEISPSSRATVASHSVREQCPVKTLISPWLLESAEWYGLSLFTYNLSSIFASFSKIRDFPNFHYRIWPYYHTVL